MLLIKYFVLWLFLSSVAFATGPQTRIFKTKDFDRVFYVCASIGNDEPSGGSLKHPWQTLKFAIQSVLKLKSQERVAIWVAGGRYSVQNLVLPSHLTLMGGFSPDFKQRDIVRFATILDGEGKNRIFVAGNHTLIDGFIFQNGRVRGKGAAIYCLGVTTSISKNIFRSNQTMMPQPWNPKYRHEIAHDGGAIYCEKTNLIIEDNIFIGNKTEIGRGGAVALHDHCNGIIRNNVLIQNITGIIDHKRSSDGGAISIFKWSRPVVEQNIFLNNQALNCNDGGGLFAALWSGVKICNNIFVGNYSDDDGGALFVGGQEHRYNRPFDKMPPVDSFYVTILSNTFIGNRNASLNSGAMRLTMETRGLFEKNVCVYNTGIYFQRSEIRIAHNLIMDDFLCKETRDWLKPYEIEHNIFGGKFILKAPAKVVNNYNLKIRQNKSSVFFQDSLFMSKMQKLKVLSANYNLNTNQTTLELKNPITEKLKNRIIRAKQKWGIINAVRGSFLIVWGDFRDAGEISILPDYQSFIQK